mmetsp:Transcript_3520/g.10224  ORF Transcript_3520/g.10224 Transcript_3520/m.10224 type:complete len:516 (+) Transcript_3520:248-1795(+)
MRHRSAQRAVGILQALRSCPSALNQALQAEATVRASQQLLVSTRCDDSGISCNTPASDHSGGSNKSLLAGWAHHVSPPSQPCSALLPGGADVACSGNGRWDGSCLNGSLGPQAAVAAARRGVLVISLAEAALRQRCHSAVQFRQVSTRPNSGSVGPDCSSLTASPASRQQLNHGHHREGQRQESSHRKNSESFIADESGAPATGSGAATSAAAATDVSAPPTWLDQGCPPRLLPYAQLMRLDKPIGTWLLLWPCLWSLALAAPPGSLPDARLAALCGVGALLLRGAGCTVNDLWDRDLDRRVERTAQRPLASGALTPLQALGLLGGQLLVGLGILLQFNNYSIVLGASALGLVFTYPLMKRLTNWPQAYLGLTFNWGALLGWAAVHSSLHLPAVLPLYGAGVCWTLVYDTIYAHQDKKDDEVVGIKSTALHFGVDTKPWLSGFAAGTVGLLGVAGCTTGCGAPFYVGLSAAAAHLAWQIRTVDLDSRQDCLDKFQSNKWFGAAVFAALLGGRLVA